MTRHRRNRTAADLVDDIMFINQNLPEEACLVGLSGEEQPKYTEDSFVANMEAEDTACEVVIDAVLEETDSRADMMKK